MYNAVVVVERFFIFLVINGFGGLANTFVPFFTVFVIDWGPLFTWPDSGYPPFYNPLQ